MSTPAPTAPRWSITDTRARAIDRVGYMIVHAVDGASTAYEGTFRAGQPDGSVVVSRSGQPDAAREFQMGRDVGSARARPQSPFAKLEG